MQKDPKSRWIASLLVQSAAPCATLPWARAAKRARRLAQLHAALPFAAQTARARIGTPRGLVHS